MKEHYAVLTPKMFGPIATHQFYAIQLIDETWHRIELLEKCNDNGSCSILFIDIGMIQNNISISKLLLLDEQFYNFKRMAIKCLMSNITPIGNSHDSWSRKAIKLLKYALECVQVDEVIRMKVENNNYGIDRSAEVILEIIKESIIINVNMSLVYFNHATTVEIQAPFRKNIDYVIQVQEYKPIPIDILSIHEAKPDEFYFAYKRFAIENIRDLIQVQMKTSVRTLTDWKEGNQCMVYYREVLGKPTQYWYRGIIEIINQKIRKCCVFLCDKGTRVVCSLSLLRHCPNEFKDIPNCCDRGHFPCLPLNASTWSRESIKMFRCILNDYNNFLITIPDSTAQGDNNCVILWGQKRGESFSELNNYCNMIKILVSAGITEADDLFQHNYAFSNDFNVKDDGLSNDESDFQLLKFGLCEVFVLEYKVELRKQQIIDWIPANKSKKIFVGLPTYVDNNSIISMTDQTEEYYLKSITHILNKYYHHNTQHTAHTFTVGQPCIVRYIHDGCK